MNQTEILLQAIEQIRPELPALVGADWPEFDAQLADYLRRLQEETDPDRRVILPMRIVELFARYPRARGRLAELRGEPPQTFRGVKGLSSRAAAPATVTRYSDITAPTRLAVGRRGVITVGLTRSPSVDSILASAMRLTTGTLEVHLQVSAADFEISGAAVKPLEVLLDRDAEPVVFYITGRSSGVKPLRLDFRQAGMVVGTATLAIEVAESAIPEAPAQDVTAAVGFSGRSIRPADLDLRVTVTPRDGGFALGYTLHSPSGVAPHHYQPFGEALLHDCASTQAYQSRLRQTLESLQGGADSDGFRLTPAQIENRLAGLGQSMWESLFPAELRRALIQSWDRAETLQVSTDDPWIPWEMMHLYDASDPNRVVDAFLCEHFQVTRWLAGDGCGAGEIVVRRLACVEAGAVPNQRELRHAAEERQHLCALAEHRGVEVHCPTPPALAAVEALLDDGRFDLWHFVGHGHLDPATPDEAPLVLQDGWLRPTDFHGRRQESIRRVRPLVFWSACRVGGAGWALAGLGGWAAKLVGKARCGAFVAPQWAADDALGSVFARIFYEALEAGETIGKAAWAARARVRNLKPADPTWLAYSVYAHPNARVAWGQNHSG